MNKVTEFIFHEHPVRVVEIDGEPWFVAKDVGDILGLENPRSSVALLDEDEKSVHTMDGDEIRVSTAYTNAGPRQFSVVSESGLYALIFKSRKPEAKAFRKWVTSDVLPSLCKTGACLKVPQQATDRNLTMNTVNKFTFNGHPVRVVEIDGEPWFVAKDVGDIMGLESPGSSVALLDEDEKGRGFFDTPGGRQGFSVVSESGLYSLIFKSRKPVAKAFRKWVASDVLPSLCKTGACLKVPQQATDRNLTMNQITFFEFENQPFRILDREGNPWFVAKDLCQILGIKNHRDAISRLDEDEKGGGFSDTNAGKRQFAIISESGLYAITMRCHDALRPGSVPHRFRKWVTSDVLPSLRKTGRYEMPDQEQEQSASRAELPVDSGEWLAAIRQGKRLYGVDFARALWEQSPLPQPTDYIGEKEGSPSSLDTMITDFLREFCIMTGKSGDFVMASKLIDRILNWAKESGHVFGPREVSLALKRVAERYIDPKTNNRPRRAKRDTSGYCGVRVVH